MPYINISHKKIYYGKIHDFSTESDADHSIHNIVKEEGFWCSRKNNSILQDFFVIDYNEDVPVNYIEVSTSPAGKTTFPVDFRIEGSTDGINWKNIQTEKSFNLGDSNIYSLHIPLTFSRFIRMFITKPGKVGTKFFSEIGNFKAGIAGIKEITASTSSSYKHDPLKLFDLDKNSYWESNITQKKEKENINIDLGNIFHINRIAISSINSSEHAFPENFIISVSKDNELWIPLLDERNFTTESSKKYYWDINLTSCRYISINMDNVKLVKNSYAVRLCEIEIYGAIINFTHTHNMGDLVPNASIFQYGLVKLAKNGEDSSDSVVQSSDTRLKDASVLNKGIVQLAEDGEDILGKSIQASDSRLKKATELKHGIVRLAKDREENPEVVVRGSDSRLQKATVTNTGIVKICQDGEYFEFGVILGNDTRVHKATTDSFGITRLADNGEINLNCVVQGNDKRLKDASTIAKGIVELAENGEDKEGVAVQGNDKRLKDASTIAKGIVELAENGEDKEGVAVQGNDKRLKDASTIAKGIVELAENGEDKEGVAVQGNDKRLKDASTIAKGIVELAENGEDKEGVAVQGNDKRLKDASTIAKGIVELAENGEDKEGVAVQGNDKRLKDASTIAKGIVELAENGEDKEGVAVQGNDKRLKDASTIAKGIVELAENGEDKEGVAVQGNDKRLKDASTIAKGIVELAENGEDKEGVAVQGNDKRLKDASTIAKGIVELAENGEDKEGVAVQGNDKRLKDASTIAKGIVELAENGEDKEGVAVQGNDNRLKTATENTYGIVRLAKNKEIKKSCVVQSDDDRLSDARPPLPHEHSYAPVMHEHNSHTGSIKIIDAKEEIINGIVPPSDRSSLIYAKNESIHPGAIAIVGVSNSSDAKSTHSYGILGHGKFAGIRGQSTGNTEGEIKGMGVLGISRFGAGGVFASEHNYSLVADGFGEISQYDGSVNLKGNGDALYVNGNSVFSGILTIKNRNKEQTSTVNIVEMFEADEEQFIMPGDILVVSDKGKSLLTRSTRKYFKGVIGIISGNPSIIINNSGSEKKIYPVVLAGKTLCRIDARQKAVKPGDLIVTSDTPGCGMAGVIDSFDKIGTVIGKALDGLGTGIGTIPVFVAHM